MFRFHLPRPGSFSFIAVAVLLLGLCLSMSSTDCYAAGHCGAPADEGHHEAAVAQVSEAAEGHEASHAHHAAVQENCPVDSSPAGDSGHQCSHHRASGADADGPSLYCNCHAKHSDGRAAQSVQEANCLTPGGTSIAPAKIHSTSPVTAEGFLKVVFLDPVEKPPTHS